MKCYADGDQKLRTDFEMIPRPPLDISPALDVSDVIEHEKSALRSKAAICRAKAARTQTGAPLRLARFAHQLISHFQPEIVAGFWPIRSELDILPLMERLTAFSLQLCLPITGEPESLLSFHSWTYGDELDKGPYGTKQPFSSRTTLIPDVILVPLLAFDGHFDRLGYGGGFYDRTLAHLQERGDQLFVIGIGYDEQKVEKIPVGPYDRRLDAMLTPSGLYRSNH